MTDLTKSLNPLIPKDHPSYIIDVIVGILHIAEIAGLVFFVFFSSFMNFDIRDFLFIKYVRRLIIEYFILLMKKRRHYSIKNSPIDRYMSIEELMTERNTFFFRVLYMSLILSVVSLLGGLTISLFYRKTEKIFTDFVLLIGIYLVNFFYENLIWWIHNRQEFIY